MIKIELTRGQVTYVSYEDKDLADFKWYAAKSVIDGTFYNYYAKRSIYDEDRKKLVCLHRVIMSRILGRPLRRDEHVDHIDGNGLNNVRSNLRVATHSQNMVNRKMQRNNTSGYVGVYWHKLLHKWVAQVRVNGKKIYLGNFSDVEDAARAYDKAAFEHYGEFARLNFPEDYADQRKTA